MIGAGTKRFPVAFHAPTYTPGTLGDSTKTYAEAYRTRAEIRHQKGDETVQAARLEGRRVLKVIVRACAGLSDLDEAWQLRDLTTDETFAIRDVDRVTRRGWIYLVAMGPLSQ